MINRTVLFKAIRPTPFNKLNQSQVDGFNYILDEWERRGLSDLRWLAYMLATVMLETGFKMQPVKEYGGLKYLKSKKYWPWFGRGYVQITWKENYLKFRQRVLDLFGVDIIDNPDNALLPHVAAFIMFEGMLNGEFSKGNKLSKFFHGDVTEWVKARAIINGKDKASTIAGYAKELYADLVLAK